MAKRKKIFKTAWAIFALIVMLSMVLFSSGIFQTAGY